MAGNRRTTQLVDSMIHLAHNRGLEVVAEGIEDAQTLKLLIDLGADIGQGFLIARPMPLAQCMDWIGEQNAQAKH
jgi:EAL domain-containing protein (putative c-di-GMP-specific phosphodiesterase class I)